ncbi:MAG: DUF3536 domain-containing protein [Candidatus Auribacterota bacterium]
MQNKYAIIHGHFYQPPRENPWTGEIERQPSAHPFHDWNDRIAAECYTPNTSSRILNETGLINDITNNFLHMSFNFGPTLLQWFERKYPEAYNKIVEADKESVKLHNGHGNAVAQVYNHVIMPLADDDDKRTQIEWGIKDFVHRFNRYPEAIWLAETAINYRTAEILMEYNLKYIILSPYQADKIRAFNSKTWINVGTGNIDTRVPYRIFAYDPSGNRLDNKFIDVFFYEPRISSAVGFEHLLTDSVRFADRIQSVFDHWSDEGQAAIVATDGESYGHHERHGDMCFGALATREIKNRHFKMTNFGHFHEMYPPQFEVILKTGNNNEGTAWSCAHGIGRWIRDCSCSDGGGWGWNQKWRGPLREAFNYLHNECNRIYANVLKEHVHDLMKMRNDYINVVLSPETKEAFLKEHLKAARSIQDTSVIFQLLEAQFNSQLMFTSCAWFFADISRIEPVQNMKYAAKVIDLLSEFTDEDIETQFLNILDTAKSNIQEFGTGKDIYLSFVKPYICYPEVIIGTYAMENFILNNSADGEIFFYSVKPLLCEKNTDTDKPVYKGMVKLINKKTEKKQDFIYYLFVPSYRDMRCYILSPDVNLEFNISPLDTIEERIAELAHYRFYGLKNLIGYNREKLIEMALHSEMQRLDKTFNTIYRKNVDLLATLTQYDLPLPNVLKEVCSYALTNEVNRQIAKLNQKKVPLSKTYKDYKKIRELFFDSRKAGLHINTTHVQEDFNAIILSKLNDLLNKLDIELAKTTLDFINLAVEMGLQLDYFHMQNIVYRLLTEDILYSKPAQNLKKSLECIEHILKITKKLSFNVDKFSKIAELHVE